jgi:hypothetical protein
MDDAVSVTDFVEQVNGEGVAIVTLGAEPLGVSV